MKILRAVIYAFIYESHICLAQIPDPQSIIQQYASDVAGATQFNIDTSIQIPTIPAIQTGIVQSTTPTSTTETSSPTSSTSTSSPTSTTSSTSSSTSSTSSTSTSSSSTTSTSKSSSSSTTTSKSSSSSTSASASASASSSPPPPPPTHPPPNHTALGLGIGLPLALTALALTTLLSLRHKRHKQNSRLQHQSNLATSGLYPAATDNDGSQSDNRNAADVENGSEPSQGSEKPDVHEICGTEILPYSRELVGSAGVRRFEMPTRRGSVY